jgi:hypothetical protein
MRTKTTITVETWRTTRVTQTGAGNKTSCPVCGTETEAIAPHGAQTLRSIEDEVLRLIGAGEPETPADGEEE